MNVKDIINLKFEYSSIFKCVETTLQCGTSDCNEYIPLYSIGMHYLIEVEGVRVVEYSKPVFKGYISRGYTYTNLIHMLINTTFPYKHDYTVNGKNYELNLMRGMLFDEEGILLCVGVKSDYILQNPLEEIIDSPNKDDIILLINNRFESTPKYKNVLKRVQKEYIDIFKKLGVDVLYTSNINKWFFNNNYKNPIFKNISGIQKYLKEETIKILLE